MGTRDFVSTPLLFNHWHVVCLSDIIEPNYLSRKQDSPPNDKKIKGEDRKIRTQHEFNTCQDIEQSTSVTFRLVEIFLPLLEAHIFLNLKKLVVRFEIN